MKSGLWGRKIGMTQLFVDEKAVPVTAITVGGWYVTGLKTVDRDGYQAVQVAQPRKRYAQVDFDPVWIKRPNKYYRAVREIKYEDGQEGFAGLEVGSVIDPTLVLKPDQLVSVTGITKGAGFAGVVRRHNFAGAPASHGAKMGRRPGALSFMTACGRVIKGKKMPGHMGVKRRVAQNVKVVSMNSETSVVLIKGSVPGKAGSLVYVQVV